MTSYRNSDPRLPIMQGSPPALVVPRMEWDRPPWNRWAFQHVREILPTAEVWRGTGPVKPLPRNERDLDGLAVTGANGEAVTLAGLLDDTYTDGFLIIKDGVIAYERYFNGMTDRTLHLSQSVAKSFTGAIAGILASQGLIDIQAPVTDVLAELNDTAYRGARLQQVLDMTSGVRFSEDYTDPYSHVGQTDVASGWKPVPPNASPSFRWPHHVFEQILGLDELERRHGDLFVYRSIETDVLAHCLERASGKRLPQLLSEELWQPLGMEESGAITVDAAGYGLASGGLNATLRDFGRFGLGYLEGIVIPPAWAEATRNGNHAIFGPPYTHSLPEGAYRNQWWIEDAKARAIYARGVFGQMIYVNWDHNLVAVKLSSWPDFLNPSFTIATQAALHRIAAVLG
jgi:CubicO group peptidase (beta-lactamase class C family)